MEIRAPNYNTARSGFAGMAAASGPPSVGSSDGPGSPTPPGGFVPPPFAARPPLAALVQSEKRFFGMLLLLFGVFTVAFSPLALIDFGGGGGLAMLLIGVVMWVVAWALGVGRYAHRALIGLAMGVFGFILLVGSLVFSVAIGIFDWGDAVAGLVIGGLGALIVYHYRDRLSRLGVGPPRIPRPEVPPGAPPPGATLPTAGSAGAPSSDRYCTSCGTGNVRTAKFCGKCGQALPELPPPA